MYIVQFKVYIVYHALYSMYSLKVFGRSNKRTVADFSSRLPLFSWWTIRAQYAAQIKSVADLVINNTPTNVWLFFVIPSHSSHNLVGDSNLEYIRTFEQWLLGAYECPINMMLTFQILACRGSLKIRHYYKCIQEERFEDWPVWIPNFGVHTKTLRFRRWTF